MRVPETNASCDLRAAHAVGDEIACAVGEERSGRRGHGRRRTPFAASEQPEIAPARHLREVGLPAADLDDVAHLLAHAASAGPASPASTASVRVLDGLGETTNHLAGRYEDGVLLTSAPLDALKLSGSTPVGLLAIGPIVIRRAARVAA